MGFTRAQLERWHPRVVAIVGLTAYRPGFVRPRALAGRQPDALDGAELWVVPKPGGLDTRDTVASLALALTYAGPVRAAGVLA